MSYLNSLAKENVWHLWSFWLSLKMKNCIVSVLKEYLPRRTEEIRWEGNKLLPSYQALQKPVSKNTLARWLRQVLNGAGVDTAQFSAHSTRVASTLAALSSGVPVDVVLRAAGWSSESTFTRFYRKEPAVNMGQALLDSYLHKN